MLLGIVQSCGTKDVIAIVDERDARGRRTKRAQRFRAVLDLDDNDNGVDDISVDEYTRLRMSRELDRYRDKARSLHRAIKFLEFAGYFLLSLCTALILVDEEVWVAVCIVLVNATANMAAVGMLEDKLARTNGAIVKVDRLRCVCCPASNVATYRLFILLQPTCISHACLSSHPIFAIIFAPYLLSMQFMVAYSRGRCEVEARVCEPLRERNGSCCHDCHHRRTAAGWWRCR